MMTPQDLQEKEFIKAMFGGYDMASVDDFLERITEDYASLYKENAVLKSKLKVLVEKVEEYRSTEDSMRMALLTAQKMGNEIVEESKEKGDAILSEVNELAKKRSYELKEKLSIEEARLREAERRTSEFSARVLKLLADEQDFITNLNELVIEAPEPEEPPALEAPPEREAAPPQAVPPQADADLEESPEAYLAQQVSQMTADLPDEPESQPEPPAQPEPTPEPEPTVEDTFADFSKMFDQDLDEAFESPAEPAAPEQVAAPETAVEVAGFTDSLFDEDDPFAEVERSIAKKEAENQKIEIARSISQSLGDDEDFKVENESLWDDEGEPTTTRPKFNFDDLQFGSNLSGDD